MSQFGQFPETTPKSSHIGQPGYNTEDDWCHFLDKYRPRIIQFGRDHYPRYRDMAEDVFEVMLARILKNPFTLVYKPTYRYRSVLICTYRRTFNTMIREMRKSGYENFREDAVTLFERSATQDVDRHRLQLLVAATIRENFLSNEYPNGRFTPEIPTLDLTIWRMLHEDQETYRSVSQKLGHSVLTIFRANKRIEKRILSEARTLLASQGLL